MTDQQESKPKKPGRPLGSSKHQVQSADGPAIGGNSYWLEMRECSRELLQRLREFHGEDGRADVVPGTESRVRRWHGHQQATSRVL